MKKNKKSTYTERKSIRLQKARQWIITYQGSATKITSNYKKRFHVDILTAVNDLQEIGVGFTEEYLQAVRKREETRIKKSRKKCGQKKAEASENIYMDSNDTFAFIVGYTSGGAPYGTTWEELGLEPYAPIEELMAAYNKT